jgi:hypothetical protein
MDPVYLDFVAQERNEKDVRVKRGAKIEGGEMVFWCSQEQPVSTGFPSSFLCWKRHTFTAKEVPMTSDDH